MTDMYYLTDLELQAAHIKMLAQAP